MKMPPREGRRVLSVMVLISYSLINVLVKVISYEKYKLLFYQDNNYNLRGGEGREGEEKSFN
jgi:hypothetical protein